MSWPSVLGRLVEQLAMKDEQLRQANIIIAQLTSRPLELATPSPSPQPHTEPTGPTEATVSPRSPRERHRPPWVPVGHRRPNAPGGGGGEAGAPSCARLEDAMERRRTQAEVNARRDRIDARFLAVASLCPGFEARATEEKVWLGGAMRALHGTFGRVFDFVEVHEYVLAWEELYRIARNREAPPQFWAAFAELGSSWKSLGGTPTLQDALRRSGQDTPATEP